MRKYPVTFTLILILLSLFLALVLPGYGQNSPVARAQTLTAVIPEYNVSSSTNAAPFQVPALLPGVVQQTGNDTIVPFSTLDFTEETLRGPFGATQLRFNLPAHWQLKEGAALQLNLNTFLSGVGFAPDADTSHLSF